MIKYILLLLLPLTLFGQSQKISDMTAATSVTGAELVPIVQTTNKKATVAQIRGWNPLGSANQLLRVNAGATALEFFTPSYLSGVVGIANGGTGLSTLGTANQLLRVNAGATALEYYTPTPYTFSNGLTESGGAVSLGGALTGSISFPSNRTHDVTFGSFTYANALNQFNVYTDNQVYIQTGDVSVTRSRISTTLSIAQLEHYDGTGTSYVVAQPQLAGIYSAGVPKVYVRSDAGFEGVNIDVGSDATGDTYYRNSSGYFSRLPVGTNGHVLTLSGGLPSWAAPTSGFSDPMTTRGDLIYRNASNVTARLPVGANTYVLTSDGTDVAWAAPSGGGGTWGSITGTLSSQTDLQTALDGKWSLASGGTLTGANTITGTTTNILKGVFNSLGTTQTNGAGLWLANTTAASSGNQQHSPSLVLEGQGWKTNSTAASQSVKWAIDVTPVQAAANPTSILKFKSSINGGAYSDIMTLTSGTLLTVPAIRSSNLTGVSGDNLALEAGTSAGRIQANLNTPTGIGSFVFASSFEVNKASGDVGSISLTHGFAPTSGTATYYGFNIGNTINQTGGANGAVNMLHVRPTYTSAAGTTRGFYYNPSGTPSGTHNAIETTAGDTKLAANLYLTTAPDAGEDHSNFIVRDGSTGELKTRRIHATIPISSAELLALNGTPKTLIAAPGSGYIIQVETITIIYTYSTAPYATNTDLEIDLAGVDLGYSLTNIINQSNNNTRYGLTAPNLQTTSDLTNGALTIKTKTGNPTAGSGTLNVLITYNIIGV